jgi:hypothetical protein
VACLGDTQLVSPPKVPPTTITLEFRADSEDLASATALGWENGIPGVQVTLAPEDSTSGSPQVFQGSDSGTLILDHLPGGRYVVDAVRWLTDSERAQLPAGDDAVGFLGRMPLSTMTATARTRFGLVASRRRGIVISEWKGDELFTTADGQYNFSGYVRLYNNTDSVAYLDGLIIGSGLAWPFDFPNYPCSVFAPYALDSSGIWALFFHKLPGRGTDYPMLPGGTAVLATDAIDHRALYPGALDLHGAQFEFYAGASDVDNPDVPNAADVGMQQYPLGHGLNWISLAAVTWIARAFDPATVQTQLLGDGRVWARVPANTLLDVMSNRTTWQGEYRPCSRLVSPEFDQLEVQLLGARPEDSFRAYRRRQLPLTINGRPVLQHTHTSAWDFVVAPMNPFAQP